MEFNLKKKKKALQRFHFTCKAVFKLAYDLAASYFNAHSKCRTCDDAKVFISEWFSELFYSENK